MIVAEALEVAQYLDNMMQQIGRGNVRAIDKDAIAGKMTAYALTTNNDRFIRLAAQYSDCVTDKLEYDGIAVTQPTGRLARIVDYLGSYGDKQDVEAKAVETALALSCADIAMINPLKGCPVVR